MNYPESRVREFAYQIWESEGRPSGQDMRHWEMAEKLARSELQLKNAKQPMAQARPLQQQPDASVSAPVDAGVPTAIDKKEAKKAASKTKTASAATSKPKKAASASKSAKANGEKSERVKKSKLMKDTVETELPPQ